MFVGADASVQSESHLINEVLGVIKQKNPMVLKKLPDHQSDALFKQLKLVNDARAQQ